MVRGKQKKEVLSYSERQGLQEQKRDAEGVLRTVKEEKEGSAGAARIDEGALRREINYLEEQIRRGTPSKSADKDKMNSEAKGIAEKLKDGMPTRYEMDHPAKCPGAVRKHMSWNKRNKSEINRYIQIQRTLNPDAPRHIEELRKEK